jgi:hypothetical protein
MRKIKEILRLRLLGGISSARRIGLAVGCGKTAVAECLRRAVAPGSRTVIEALDETVLEQRLYPTNCGVRLLRQRPLPDWGRIREELARRDHQETLALLWTEYKAEHPDGYQYSQHAELYRQYDKRLSVVLRQNHAPGARRQLS